MNIKRHWSVTILLILIVVGGMYLISRPQKRFLAIPSGFSASSKDNEEDYVFVQPAEGDRADTMIFSAGKELVEKQTIEQLVTSAVVFDASGTNPKKLSEFRRLQEGSVPIYVIQSGRFEGVITVSFIGVIEKKIYPVTASWYVGERWMDALYNPFQDEKYRSYESLVKNYISLIEQGFSPEDILPKNTQGIE